MLNRVLWGVLASGAGLFAAAFYMEYVMGLVPCALCLAQRIALGLTLVAVLFVLVTPRWGRPLGALLMACFAAGGAALAARQVWLQSLPPDQVPDCGPDIYFMLDRFPLTESIRAMLLGTGNCAEVQWTSLTLSIPQWTLLWFLAYAVVGLTVLIATLRQPTDSVPGALTP